MANVLLCGPFAEDLAVKINYAAPPLGPHRIAAWLRRYGHYAEVYDCNINGDFGETLESRKWDIIGFSTLQTSLACDIRASRLVKKVCPEALIIFGGLEPTLNYQDILDCAPCDLVALGEGEKLILDLADGKAIAETSGYIWRNYAAPTTTEEFADWWGEIDFAGMRYPEYWAQTQAASKDADKQTINTIRLITSSHCNRGCVFCSVTRWHAAACGKITRIVCLSPEQVYRLVCKAIRQVPEVESFYFCEDDFVVTRERAWDAFSLLGKTGKKFLVQTRLDKVDRELIQHLAKNGCFHITLGIENASERVQRDLGKPLKNGRIPQVIEWCKEAGIRPYLLFILFCPTSTIEDLRTNHTEITKWADMGATISVEPHMMCYRGSPLWDSSHEMLYEAVPVDDGPRRVGKRTALRIPTRVLPDDLAARHIALEFAERWPAYLEAQKVGHTFKGATGRLMVNLLGELLEEHE